MSCNGPQGRNSLRHEQPGLCVRSAPRFLQKPRDTNAAQPFLTDFRSLVDECFGGADGAVVVGYSGSWEASIPDHVRPRFRRV